ncbi:MAG: SDR family NAD(P)-dependent oxidoreductase [Hyphomicrobiales bacterium]|nr:SDR family NAD(P)-dependent oxidoreductase [Hyphomicrobiales bacterium]
MNRLQDKTTLITDAARGIGRAFATAFAGEGATVAIADINAEAGKATAETIEVAFAGPLWTVATE